MTPTIKIDERAPGRGKTQDAIRRMKSELDIRFLYVAPLIDLLDEVESEIAPRKRGRPTLARVATWARVDSSDAAGKGRIPERLRRSLCSDLDTLDFSARVVGITHYSLWHLTPAMVKDRVVIIDEMPTWLEFVSGTESDCWDVLERDGKISQDSEQNVHVTPVGRATLSARINGCKVAKAFQEQLADVARGQAVRISPQFVRVSLRPDALAAAREVVLMTANRDAGYFPEWCALAGATVTYTDATSEPLQCENAAIYYLDARGAFTSMEWLRFEVGRLGQSAAAALGQFSGASQRHLIARNPKMKRAVDSCFGDRASIVSPAVRGLNQYRDCDLMVWLAAMQPTPQHIGFARSISGRSREEIVAAQHGEALYQFVMRCKLREDDNAHVNIIVPTRGDAEYLASVIGATNVRQFGGAI